MAYVILFATEPQREALLIGAIKNLGDWGELTPTAYILQGELDPGRTMEILQPMLGPKDSLWVVRASGPWAGYGDTLAEELAAAWVGAEASWVPRDWDEAAQLRP